MLYTLEKNCGKHFENLFCNVLGFQFLHKRLPLYDSSDKFQWNWQHGAVIPIAKIRQTQQSPALAWKLSNKVEPRTMQLTYL